jgi:hypothetical protein
MAGTMSVPAEAAEHWSDALLDASGQQTDPLTAVAGTRTVYA